MDVWIRWVVGGIGGLLVTLLLFRIDVVNQHNLRQDEQITEGLRQVLVLEEQAFRDLFKQNADTARILEGVVRKLEAIDERGSRALNSHRFDEHRSEQ